MKILHTADLHLGKIFHAVHLTDDQEYILQEIEKIIEAENVDVYIIAGDIYDRSIAPVDAIRILNNHLEIVAGRLNCKVIMISGNHDQGIRLATGAFFLEKAGIYICTEYKKENTGIEIEVQGTRVAFYPIPYITPADIRNEFADENILTHNDAMQRVVETITKNHDAAIPAIAVAHSFIQGGMQSDSERPLTVGGIETIDKNIFSKFTYTAMGHLHGHQRISSNLIYSGSPLKYSASEIDHKKSVTLVDIKKIDAIEIKEFPLKPKRDLRIVSGTFNEILENGEKDHNNKDYIIASIKGNSIIYEGMRRLKEIYPNAIKIVRENVVNSKRTNAIDHTKMNEEDLFKSFYKLVEEKNIPEEQLVLFQQALEKSREALQ